MLLKIQKQQNNTIIDGVITVGLYALFVIAKDIVDDVVLEMQHEVLSIYRSNREQLLHGYKFNNDSSEFINEFQKRIMRYNDNIVSALYETGRCNHILKIDLINTTRISLKRGLLDIPIEIPNWLYSIPRRVMLPLVICDNQDITINKIIHG